MTLVERSVRWMWARFRMVFFGEAFQQPDFLWSQADVLDASSRHSVHPSKTAYAVMTILLTIHFLHAECVNHS